MTNKYYKYSKISEAKFRQLVRYFASDFTASYAADRLPTFMAYCDPVVGYLYAYGRNH